MKRNSFPRVHPGTPFPRWGRGQGEGVSERTLNIVRRPGFSLIEMMIAIVLLGLGMVMVATMFPVAWTRARDVSDQTHLSTVAQAADATIGLLARVDGRNTEGSSFAGDLVFLLNDHYGFSQFPYAPGGIVSFSDTRVHAMSLENLLVVGSRRFVPDLPDDRKDIYFYVHPLHDLTAPEYVERMFISSQVRLESRVHPPMRSRKSRDLSQADNSWDEALDTRRYVWSVLHRLRSIVVPTALPSGLGSSGIPSPYFAEWEAYKGINVPREFDLYYVMLRRPQANLRYAQQDQRYAPDPLTFPPRPETPRALPPERDVIFPVPWRVQVFFRGPFAAPNSPDETGVPSEVEINPPAPDPRSAAFVVDMFPVGAWFVDELTGHVYRVTARRLSGPQQDHAYLTLDREILTNDLPDSTGLFPPAMPLFPALEHQLRTVWVYPPPSQALRADNANKDPIFAGPQPVVGMEMRSLTISPLD